jgi:sugar/nucleoside kinase (ribokinase family)
LTAPLTFDDVPAEWRDVPIVLLAPVFHDVDEECSRLFAQRGGLVGLGVQGWLRRLVDGRVLPGEVTARPRWLAGEVVFVSEEDVTEPEAVAEWQEGDLIVVLTRGIGGCRVWTPQSRLDFGGLPVEEVDPTGAGDVFAAAFLVRLHETADVCEAARFACAAGALSVRATGAAGIGSRPEIEALLRAQAVAS